MWKGSDEFRRKQKVQSLCILKPTCLNRNGHRKEVHPNSKQQNMIPHVINSRLFTLVHCSLAEYKLIVRNSNNYKKHILSLLTIIQTIHFPLLAITQTIHFPLLAITQSIHFPLLAITQTIQLPLLTITQTIHLPLLAITQTIHLPLLAITQTIHLPLLAITQTIYLYMAT